MGTEPTDLRLEICPTGKFKILGLMRQTKENQNQILYNLFFKI